jgi:predicted HicB family RNase H-like nuclease
LNNLSYKNYYASIQFETDSDVFVGRLIGITDIITFEADSVDGLKAAFHDAVDDYLSHCAKTNKEPQKYFSGKVMLRIDPKVHADLAKAAELSNAKSMNEFAEAALHREAQAVLATNR